MSKLNIISFNVEGLSAAKEKLLADICIKYDCHILCIQETHRGIKDHRPVISGMSLVIEKYHDKHGSAIFVKNNLDFSECFISDVSDIETLNVIFEDFIVTSVYKPPNISFDLPIMNSNVPKVRIIIGDFNSHSTTWGYYETNKDGEKVEEFMENHSMHLIHDAKLPSSFNSCRWRRGYNPDLIFVSENIKGNCVKKVLEPIPHSQHRPIMLQIRSIIEPKSVPYRCRFNFKKADWINFRRELDLAVEHIEPTTDNYDIFIETIKTVSRKFIPRGCRTQYIPGLTDDLKVLYEDYIKSYNLDPFSEDTISLGINVSTEIANYRRLEWESIITNIDMKHSSRQAWKTLKKINNDPTTPKENILVSANQIAQQLVLNGKPDNKQKSLPITKSEEETNLYSQPFILNELQESIRSLKIGKAAGLDDIRNEQIINFGPVTINWILNLFNFCLFSKNIPKIWRKSKVIAIPKPGKKLDDPKNFRPISLLCTLYKLFERILLNRLSINIDKQLLPEQAGFRPGKNCTGQVLNLTQFIENGFQSNLKTGAVFVDLSSAYDTVNHNRLIWKLYQVTNDYNLIEIIRTLLSNRRFFVELGSKRSRWRIQKNGLPQGSVLAPTLFNIYTNDQPTDDINRRFLYADDLCITYQHKDICVIEDKLSSALHNLSVYYQENCLKANASKTVISLFHLNNKEADRTLNISWNGQLLHFNSTPTYLGITLGRTLSYSHHIKKTS